jgi:inorganic phosphate transporter, PiT family
METILFGLIILTAFYMAWNIGANDVANAMGTSVGSGALSLRQAVLIAAVLEFSGAFFFGSHVSKTVQSGIINEEIFAQTPQILVYGMLSALASAGIWLQIASYNGWPVSTTHTIIGAIVGFGAIVGGVHAVHWGEVAYIVSSWILSPLIGGILAFVIFSVLRKMIFYHPRPLEATRRLAPLLVFCVITVLAFVLVFEGLRNINIEIDYPIKGLIPILIGAVASFISFLFIRRTTIPKEVAAPETSYGADLTNSLEKARKHLQKVRSLSHGDLSYHVRLLVDEVEELEQSVKKTQEMSSSHSEYLAVERIFSFLQIISACMMAFAHGANDVANAIGPLSAALAILTTGIYTVDSPVPTWTLALGGVGIVVGLATWGWRVIETIGRKITELTPSRGFAAEFGAATTIVIASRLGLPISATHTLVGAVLGVGLARGLEAVNINTTRDILVSWVVTVPIGALLALALFYPIRAIFG